LDTDCACLNPDLKGKWLGLAGVHLAISAGTTTIGSSLHGDTFNYTFQSRFNVVEQVSEMGIFALTYIKSLLCCWLVKRWLVQ
jgi:hypothetical protein